MPDDKTLELVGLSTSALGIAIVTLVQMLERRQVLEPGAYLRAIKDTFNHPDAKFERLDYEVLRNLARLLEGQRPAA